MPRTIVPYFFALAGVAAITWLTSMLLPVMGLASSALLFLLPVLFAAARGGLGPGLLSALAGATAYNFFLLSPRFTFRIHGLDDAVSVFVLVAVAIVTSRLATQLKTREAEAIARADASDEVAHLSAQLAAGAPDKALVTGLIWIGERHGHIQLITGGALPEGDAGFSSIDLSAAAWAMHNGDMTGHGTQVIPAADWTFIPFAPHNRPDGNLAAFARNAAGTRAEAQLSHLYQLVRLLGQAWDRIALERERRERERLEDIDRLRRVFLSSLAHDFRTPLTIITGQLETLAGSAPAVGEALAAARRLDRTMADLIGAARIEDGSISPAVESLDMVDIASAASAGAVLPEGISLERSIPADLPFVRGDAVLLHHVLINLIDNATRHARSAVMLSAERDGKQVLLSVSDDGPGIPDSERQYIFERFARLEGSDRKRGSGLGLAIVKGFAEAMGMTVIASTAPSGGARFVLALPIAAGRSD
jgi:two-component system sensor histidine kinase KdpD